jgi:3alpha(or 20beta)-hydroxysteroid dehydrogenase
MRRVDDRVVVVTGAAGGQGAAEAAALAEVGAKVIATDVKDPISDLGASVCFRRLDVAEPDSWRKLASWLSKEYGRVDGLVNNAGVTSRVRLEDVGLAEWDRVMRINATGALLGIQALLPLMGEGASIVNVSSLAGLTGHFMAAYTASKWALRGLSRVASMELGVRGIRVNTIFPAFIDSPMTVTAPRRFRESSIKEIPLGRVGSVEDVAPVVVFLISDDSRFISGAEIPIDGGEWAHGGVKVLSDAFREADDPNCQGRFP